MKKACVIFLACVMMLQASGCRFNRQEPPTTEETTLEMIEAFLKESSAATMENGEMISKSKDGYFLQQYIEPNYQITLILDEKTQEIIIMEVVDSYPADYNINPAYYTLSHMLSYAGIEYYWDSYHSAESEENAQLEKLADLHEIARTDTLIRNQYWITLRATEDNRTAIVFRKSNAQINADYFYEAGNAV